MNPSRPGKPPLFVLRIVLISALIQLGFATVIYVIALFVAWRTGEAGLTAPGALVGILCALIALLFITIFHFRRETMVLPLEDRQAFLNRLGTHLEELGYHVSLSADNHLVGRPAFHAFLFGGNIEARLGGERAILKGPKVYLEALRQRLRLHTHLEQVPHALAAVRRRHGGLLLREVRIRLQLPGELLPEVYREVAGALAREGAAIHCELAIRARGENGLRDQVIQTCVQDWLKEQRVPAQVEKEPLVPEAQRQAVAV
jgi:hypothetical protein